VTLNYVSFQILDDFYDVYQDIQNILPSTLYKAEYIQVVVVLAECDQVYHCHLGLYELSAQLEVDLLQVCWKAGPGQYQSLYHFQ